ncbi:MAG TPA: hypothetical protein VNJ08_14445 [Bacteriovoracaceae bacterium]|nr:hypothetical protein [Bacteriovoracaceae bacterium]
MKLKLIDDKIGSFPQFLSALLRSIKTSYIVGVTLVLFLVQAFGDYYMLWIDKEQLNIETSILLFALFPGLYIVVFGATVFVWRNSKHRFCIIDDEAFEAVGYKKYKRDDLISIETFGPNVLSLTFRDKKVFNFVSYDKARTLELIYRLKPYCRGHEIIKKNMGKDISFSGL